MNNQRNQIIYVDQRQNSKTNGKGKRSEKGKKF